LLLADHVSYCDCQLTSHRYDLENTLEVIVGEPTAQPKRFTIYTNVFTGRSGVLAALHRAGPDEQKKPANFKREDPELFQAYLNCVYFGPETVEQWADASEAEITAKPEGNTKDEKRIIREEKQAVADLVFEKLIRLYLLAERLIDFKTANMVIAEIIRASGLFGCIPTQGPISLAYASTVKGSPLRNLLRDYWICESASTHTNHERIRAAGFPLECLQDIAIEMLRMSGEVPADYSYVNFKTVKTIWAESVCYYHQHDELHPKCVPVDSGKHDRAPLMRSRHANFSF
jgi:hypothetical protein